MDEKTHHVRDCPVKLGQVVAGAPCVLTGLAPHRRIEQALLPGPLWGAAVLQIAGGCRKRHVRVSQPKSCKQQGMHGFKIAICGAMPCILSEAQVVHTTCLLAVKM